MAVKKETKKSPTQAVEFVSYTIGQDLLNWKNNKSYLFSLPPNSGLEGYKVWVNSAWVRRQKDGSFKISYIPGGTFKYKVIKSEKQGEKWVNLDTIEFTPEELASKFN